MKKGRSKAILCCLGLVLFAASGCVTVQQEAKPAAKPEVMVAEGPEMTTPAGEASGKKVVPGSVATVRKEAGTVPPVAEVRRVPTKYNVYQYLPDSSKTLGTEILLSEMTKEIAGKVYYEMQEEGEQPITGKIAVVNAVPLSDLKRDTEFGRVMGEYLLTDLSDRGLKVTELRLGKDITILPQTGEFILSRNVGELANKMPDLEYVVVTTFANTRKTLVVQGRLVRLTDGAVKTSWRYSMPLNRELLGLFQPAEAPYKIAVKGIGR
ncbi:FlgO family outer membrane protein [Thiovibrio frasassiensis]|jgi:hypothetical protein|uniref:FlgO family outer membrane protein n=1 Tax=Thiovibrio frasassiensis TaxID=2984131 RepID=A0A9X4RLL9_9BACT|nr:FlgO family outer membrane protein [Thiovibrio frasassiensis]MDG4475460.1 FlgO family outer membrane protein [Thiovibrio frasassiensis]